MTKAWEERYADLLERIMATAVVDGDTRPFLEEMAKLISEKPEQPKKRKKNDSSKG